MTEVVIETRKLTLFYGKHRGIIDVDLTVNKGEVFGFLGPNGAGKTTTQRVLLDIIRPNKGNAKIFGLDCQKQGSDIRKRVGYLPGELSLYPNMKAIDFLDLFASFYSGVADKKYRGKLIERLDLNPHRQMKHYSRGNKQKIGVVAAFMNKPDLLILDEPTASLDPLIQQAILELVRETKNEGRTVFFSSHNLTEVQAVCDRVGIIREGLLIKTERVETLTRQRFIRLKLTLRDNPPLDVYQNIDGVIEVARDGHTVVFEVQRNLEVLMDKTASFGITNIETLPVTLEEIFLAFYGRNGANHV